jgi:excisionase family DNA binding protein
VQEKHSQQPLRRVAYRPREVAEMVGMSESGVRNLIKRGTLRAVQWDGRWLIPASVIEAALGFQLDANAASTTAPQGRATPLIDESPGGVGSTSPGHASRRVGPMTHPNGSASVLPIYSSDPPSGTASGGGQDVA